MVVAQLPSLLIQEPVVSPLDQSAPHRVLIVSPHLPPINAPDHHRVRLALPYLARHGWSGEVLAVDPREVEAAMDPELARALPPEFIVHRVGALPARWTRRLGFGNLALRAYRNLRRRGNELLATGRFDLVFFSTTQFGVLSLGPEWKRRHGVPYVLDFQDEWVSGYYRNHPKITPPGGRLKYGVSRYLAKRAEPRVIQHSAQIISVSQGYNEGFRSRYPELPKDRFHELPFGGAPNDFNHLDGVETRHDLFDPCDGRKHWVYVGRGGSDLSFSARAFFSAVQRAVKARLLQADELRLHFIGTSYAPPKSARESFLPLARAYGLEGIVSEHPRRVPYFTALQCLRQASAVLVFGSDDSTYTASKIFPALLARRPLLSILHEQSNAVEILRRTRCGTLVTFRSYDSPQKVADEILRTWILNEAFEQTPAMKENDFAPFSAKAMTRQLCRIFETARVATVSRL